MQGHYTRITGTMQMLGAKRINAAWVEVNMSATGDEVFVIKTEDAIILRDSLNMAVSENVDLYERLLKEGARIFDKLTPEAMGLPPDTSPQTFAGLTGQQIPPAEELRMIAGKKSVGHKREKK